MLLKGIFIFEKVHFEKVSGRQKKHKNYAACVHVYKLIWVLSHMRIKVTQSLNAQCKATCILKDYGKVR